MVVASGSITQGMEDDAALLPNVGVAVRISFHLDNFLSLVPKAR